MPFYIGDWEQDLNACEIETEGAWLKIIVKMFKDDKSGVYKTTTKALQRLWKSDAEKIQEIIDDLLLNDVCIIKCSDNSIEFRNRRMIKAKKISKVRSDAVQTRYKSSTNDSTKSVETPEYENESENESEIKKDAHLIFSEKNQDNLINEIKNSERWKEGTASIYKVDMNTLNERLNFFLSREENNGALIGRSLKEIKSYFCNFLNLNKGQKEKKSPIVSMN